MSTSWAMIRLRLVQVVLALAFVALIAAALSMLWLSRGIWQDWTRFYALHDLAVLGLAVAGGAVGLAVVLRGGTRPGVLPIAGLLLGLQLHAGATHYLQATIRAFSSGYVGRVVGQILAVVAIGLILGFFVRLSQELRPARALDPDSADSDEASITGGLIRSAFSNPLAVWLLALSLPVAFYKLQTDGMSAFREQLTRLVAPTRDAITSGDYYGLFVAQTGVDIAGITATAINVLGFAAVMAALAFGVTNLTSAFKGADVVDRRRVAWVLVPVAIALFLYLAWFAVRLLPLSGPVYSWSFYWVPQFLLLIVTAVFTFSMAAAIFGAGIIDSDLVLRRTTVYGATAVVGLFVFAGIENVMAGYVARRLGLPEAIGTWISAGCAALALQPIREWVRKRGARLAAGKVAAATVAD